MSMCMQSCVYVCVRLHACLRVLRGVQGGFGWRQMARGLVSSGVFCLPKIRGKQSQHSVLHLASAVHGFIDTFMSFQTFKDLKQFWLSVIDMSVFDTDDKIRLDRPKIR